MGNEMEEKTHLAVKSGMRRHKAHKKNVQFEQ